MKHLKVLEDEGILHIKDLEEYIYTVLT